MHELRRRDVDGCCWIVGAVLLSKIVCMLLISLCLWRLIAADICKVLNIFKVDACSQR